MRLARPELATLHALHWWLKAQHLGGDAKGPALVRIVLLLAAIMRTVTASALLCTLLAATGCSSPSASRSQYPDPQRPPPVQTHPRVMSLVPASGSFVPGHLPAIMLTFDTPMRAEHMRPTDYNGNSDCAEHLGVGRNMNLRLDYTYVDGRVERGVCMGMNMRTVDHRSYMLTPRRPVHVGINSNGYEMFGVRSIDVTFELRSQIALVTPGTNIAPFQPVRDVRGRPMEGDIVARFRVQ